VKIKLMVFMLSIMMPVASWATEWTGTVVGISDGDTVTVLNTEKRQVKIRLTEIDAPESKQAFGAQSKQSLTELCFKKTVVVIDNGTDKYKRTLGRIRCDGVDANAEQVKRGMAWAYRQYLTDQSIASFEDIAKAEKLGLWADNEPMPPWEFRHGGKAIKAKADVKSNSTSSSSHLECAGKSMCKDMSNCAEANFYLNECGVKRLDRDHDGIPCESLCK
jgi:endonuclease YncB( thermonuclease family)